MRITTLLLVIFFVAAFPVSAQARKAGDIVIEQTTYVPDEGEPVSAERGTLWVPANRGESDTSLYELAFIRFKSTSDNPGAPIVYLAGGPGGSGIESARGARFPLFMAMRAFGDVIAFDQRGTGASLPKPTITTQFDYPLDEPIEFDRYIEPIITQTKAQLDKLESEGLDLESFNTEESADDLNALRIALGAEKISLWGISYGTHLGLSTVRRHGEHIDKVIFAGLEGPDQSVKLPKDQQELLEEIALRAKADPELGELVPDLMVLINEVLSDLEREPVTVKAFDPDKRERIEVLVDKWTMQVHTASLLGVSTSSSMIPRLYYQAAQGDFRLVANTAMRLRGGTQTQYAMSLLMDCASGATDARMARVREQVNATLLGAAINGTYPAICEACGDINLGDAFRGPLESDVPALFISGTLDGRTAPANAEELLPGFPNAQHLIVEGAGHSDELFLSSPKILEAMEAFMRGDTLSATRIELPPMKFSIPRVRKSR